jgi:hypothetical protein
MLLVNLNATDGFKRKLFELLLYSFAVDYFCIVLKIGNSENGEF